MSVEYSNRKHAVLTLCGAEETGSLYAFGNSSPTRQPFKHTLLLVWITEPHLEKHHLPMIQK